jgi:hypothetical protein
VFYVIGIIILASYPISRAYYDSMISEAVPGGLQVKAVPAAD